ncbi:alcohol dehydrogenase GroES domain protein [Setomelanomma holmii]|uniref:Alcohol dehydrogenase GroES domain protein n=1 Tax=Setomelanomma holmii TaxID=210430 RepID=A0A9P4H9P9_9PLEO|nr:alcohol dehydrogenase GroES domain protein [Setomelanomma holmii]
MQITRILFRRGLPTQHIAHKQVQEPTDAIIKLRYSKVCGTDLHILRGDVPTIPKSRILGHEGVGVVESIGAGVRAFKKGDNVLISCITSCGGCEYCRRGMFSHCKTGGWSLGNKIDETQAEAAFVMLSDIFPTGFECGVLNGKVAPGSSVAIVGAGPVGLAALINAQLYSPSTIVMIDGDENRLEIAKSFGATHVAKPEHAIDVVKVATSGRGCDTVMEAVGIPDTFQQCQEMVAPGGTIANVRVHGVKADLHLESLWDKNIAITTKLVDTTSTPMLMNLLASGKLPAEKLLTHRFKFEDTEQAYETFKAARTEKTFKVLIEM